jgi:hypothetical protein
MVERISQLPKRERRRLTAKNLDVAMATILGSSPSQTPTPTPPNMPSGRALRALAQDIGVEPDSLASALRALLEPSAPAVMVTQPVAKHSEVG